MTKKKRELIEILLDNVKPEDWPEHLPYAVYGKETCKCYAAVDAPIRSGRYWILNDKPKCKLIFESTEQPRHWNKTIVHRDEFMKRWNERNQVVDSEGWIQWNGGEMPVEKGTLVDVKYRGEPENIGVKAGVFGCYTGSNRSMNASSWNHRGRQGDIIAYRLHAPQQQKTPQQLALEKFGTDWHDNEGVQPVDNGILVDFEIQNKKEFGLRAGYYDFGLTQSIPVTKWRIHSDEKELQISEKEKTRKWLSKPMPPCSEEIPCRFVDVKEKKYLDKVDGELVGIEKVIADRGSNYGRFEDGAEIMQQLKLIAHTSQGWERMKPVQREAMDMILHKIGRILNGDPSYIDSWVDIEGYSNLVSSWLKGESK